jgi:hypothetical protein
MTIESKLQGIILFAHGSRDPLWRLPIEAVALQIKQQSPQVDVACAFLELTEPDLQTTTQLMAQKGLRHIAIVPMFYQVWSRNSKCNTPTFTLTFVAPSVKNLN